jgi:transposase
MKSRRKYDEQFKRDAVALVVSTGKSISEAASNLGIRYDILSRWIREMKSDSPKVFPGNGNNRDEEMARLRKENAELKMERDILKKAVAIFSVHEK